jgi:hypothetical protein
MDYEDAYKQLKEILEIEEFSFSNYLLISNCEDAFLSLVVDLFSRRHPIYKKLEDGFRDSKGLFYTPKNKSFSIDVSDIFKAWNALLLKQKRQP